jgi:hypothetical protein
LRSAIKEAASHILKTELDLKLEAAEDRKDSILDLVKEKVRTPFFVFRFVMS